MPNVLVTDAGRGSAIAVIRSLGRQGWNVIAADSDRHSPGFRSRFTRWKLLYPPPEVDQAATAQAILQEAKRRAVTLVVPVTDDVILPLRAIRPAFDGVSVLAMPSSDALSVVSDKEATLRLAESLGVPVPRSHVVRGDAEARQIIGDIGWPVVVKPRVSRTNGEGTGIKRHEVSYACDPEQLTRALEREGDEPVLLQEYSEGEGHGVELLLKEGRPLAAFQHRRLREVPVTGGASSFRESVPLDPMLYLHAARLLESLSYTGLAMVEFRVGPKGPRLMEINGRIWGSLPLAVKSGVDFPSLMARMYLGEDFRRAEVLRDYRVGVRSRNLPLEVSWIGSVLLHSRDVCLPMPPRRDAMRVAARLLYPGDGYDVLSAEDPLPGLAEFAKVLRDRAKRAGRRQ
jgi:predicted ATP-grasp superfamily ATP-dependent carboligase